MVYQECDIIDLPVLFVIIANTYYKASDGNLLFIEHSEKFKLFLPLKINAHFNDFRAAI